MKYPILLPNIFNHPFTYESDLKLNLGDYVIVPFGKSKLTGVVWDDFEKEQRKEFKLKKIYQKLNVPSLSKNMIKFLNWFSSYNIIPKGMALKLILLSDNAIEKLSDNRYEDYLINIKNHNLKLSLEQNKSLNIMNKSNRKFRVHVLQGTTGSGKQLFILRQ